MLPPFVSGTVRANYCFIVSYIGILFFSVGRSLKDVHILYTL